MASTNEQYSTVVRLLIGGTAFVVMARAMSMPFLAIYLHRRLGLDAATIGLVIGGGALAGALGGLFGGWLSDLVGRRKVLLFSLLASAIAFCALQFAASTAQVFAVNLAISLASAFYEPVSKAMISDQLVAHKRLQAFSHRYIANNLGFAVGPLVGAYLGLVDNSIAFLVTGGVYLVFLACMFGATRGAAAVVPAPHSATKVALAATWGTVARDKRLLLFTVGSTLAVAAHGEMSVTFSQYLAASFVDGLTMFAWLMSANAVTVVVSQPFLRRVGERKGPLTSVVLGALLLAAGSVAFAYSGDLTLLVLSMVVFTCGEVLLVPAEYAILDAITPEALRGAYYGVHSLSSIGNLLGPWLGGLVLIHLGGVALFYSMAAAALLSMVVFIAGSRLPLRVNGAVALN